MSALEFIGKIVVVGIMISVVFSLVMHVNRCETDSDCEGTKVKPGCSYIRDEITRELIKAECRNPRG